MAKLKKEKFNSKNIKINEEELSITKIGELETTEQSSAFILILFGILLVFIFFLPNIEKLINGSDEKPDYSVNETQNNKENDQDEENDTQDVYYNFSDALSISLEKNIIIHEFSLNGNELAFKITNTGETRFSFQKDNYFLEMYSEEDTLLERILLSDIVVSKENAILFTYTLSSSTSTNMKKLKFIKKAIADYPNVALEKNESGEEILICTKDTETITYKFQNEKLFSITDVANYSSTVANYTSLLNTWKTDAEKLNNIEGIQSIFVDAGNGFVVNTTMDLKTAKLTNVENANYYAYETLAKVVKFEMDARGFRCK